MPLLYEIDKQLIDIAKKFDSKFTKHGQEASAIQSTALKLLENLQSQMNAVNTNDIKSLRNLIEYCLNRGKLASDGLKLVYYGDKTLFGSATLSKEFGDAVPDQKKNEYVEYNDAEVSYYVNKQGLIDFIASLQQQASAEKNKIVEVMLSKLIDEANAKLQLGIDKNKINTNPGADKKQEGQADGYGGHGNQQKQETKPGAKPSEKDVEVAQDKLEKETFGKLGGNRGPLESNQIDLEKIRLFVDNVKASLDQDYFKIWAQFAYGYDDMTKPQNQAALNQMKSEISRYCDEISRSTSILRQNYLNTHIIPSDAVVIGSGPGLMANFRPLMQQGRQTGAPMAEVTNALRRIVRAVPQLLKYITQHKSYLESQNSIGRNWDDNLAKVYDAANLNAQQEASKLPK